MATGAALVWFRDDLRLGDQPALAAAVASGRPVLCAYILDEESEGLRAQGGASRWWLHHSLARLGEALEAKGARLDVYRGAAQSVIEELVASAGVGAVFWTRRYEAGARALDTGVKAALAARGVEAASFNGQLLHEPWTVTPKAGGYFRVFTPYWRAVRALPAPDAPLPAPERIHGAPAPKHLARVGLDDLGLLPRRPDWAAGLRDTWTPGEAGAHARLDRLGETGLADYGEGRDHPDVEATSRLSPHLHFGEVTPRQVWHYVDHMAGAKGAHRGEVDKFLSEIGWREFSYSLLFNFPDLAERDFNAKFQGLRLPTANAAHVEAWKRGRTGYPIVDAGMRQLWQTGWMHNRVRMITASFLAKDLMVDWRVGEAWFWDTLCCADPANNAGGWQWVAGTGADASPYYRVFNPVLQGQKFDSLGGYVRRYVPELAKLHARDIHEPWKAPAKALAAAGVRLGHDYPLPIVDHGEARAQALARYAELRA